MFIDPIVHIDNPLYVEAEYQEGAELLVWLSTGSRLLVRDVSLEEFLDLQRKADHQAIVKLLATHRRQWV